jgi:hypothetical protein
MTPDTPSKHEALFSLLYGDGFPFEREEIRVVVSHQNHTTHKATTIINIE